MDLQPRPRHQRLALRVTTTNRFHARSQPLAIKFIDEGLAVKPLKVNNQTYEMLRGLSASCPAVWSCLGAPHGLSKTFPGDLTPVYWSLIEQIAEILCGQEEKAFCWPNLYGALCGSLGRSHACRPKSVCPAFGEATDSDEPPPMADPLLWLMKELRPKFPVLRSWSAATCPSPAPPFPQSEATTGAPLPTLAP